MKRGKRRHKLWIGMAAAVVLLNAAAWNSTAFCDAYIAWIFPVWVNTYGRITGLFPFSVGEWMIVAGLVLLGCAFVLAPAAALAVCIPLPAFRRIRGKCLGMVKGFYVFFIWTLLIVCLVMTLNCFILYHASTFSEKYFGERGSEAEGTYTANELILLYNEIAEKCNTLSRQVERDEQGRIVYPGGLLENGEIGTMEEKAIEIMKQLGETYPQLDGYYPSPKPLFFSDFMCQQYMQGYYFPFSMEANYNDVMYILNKPACMCHELAHLRGYIYEDEANFISYLACIQSDDIYFQYSGYLSVLPYVSNDIYALQETGSGAEWDVYPIRLYEQVYEDDVFVTKEEWDRINGKAIFDTETVDQVSDAFVDTTLRVNGVEDGMVSYSRVVKLLLQYQRIQAGQEEGSGW